MSNSLLWGDILEGKFKMREQTLFTIGETPVTLVNVLACVGILILTYLLARGIKALIIRKGRTKAPVVYAFGRLAYYATVFVGIYMALLIVGIDLTGITVVIGALSVGIGFGLQSIFNNFVAGVILLIEKKVSIGDMIELDSGDMGYVQEMNMRSTLIRTLDNRKVLVPNSEIVSKKLVNWTFENDHIHRFRFPFAVSRDVKKEIVREIALEVASEIGVKKLKPDVWLSEINASNQIFELILWMERKDRGLNSESLTAQCLWSLESAFLAKGIQLIEASRNQSEL